MVYKKKLLEKKKKKNMGNFRTFSSADVRVENLHFFFSL